MLDLLLFEMIIFEVTQDLPGANVMIWTEIKK